MSAAPPKPAIFTTAPARPPRRTRHSISAPSSVHGAPIVSTTPTGIPIEEFDKVALVANALLSRTPADVDRAMAVWMARARDGAGYAENSLQFACALGRLDEAFAIADAYFFGRGFVVPEIRFSQEQGTYMPQSERLTHFLFNPVTIVMRRDPRFGP